MYALADCNNFFVSCERVFRPDLRNRPVVVLSGNDGCVIARSNEVKQLGIKMGVPFYQIQAEVKKYGIVHFSSNFALYGDLSSRVMQILSRYTPDLQQYSIDEAFLDLSYESDVRQIYRLCTEIRQKVKQGVGIPISLGVAQTKTLSKMASHYAKRYAGYNGVCMIENDSQRLKALSQYPIDEVWGIGRKARAKLNAVGIDNALQFASLSSLFARNLLNKPGWETWRELNGDSCIGIRELPEKQSITCSRTFAHSVSNRSLLEQALSEFLSTCAQRLRKQHSVCRQLIVFAHGSRFRDERAVMYEVLTLPIPTSNTQEMQEYLLRVVRQRFQEGDEYKRAGVILMGIEPDTGVQTMMFDTRDRQRDQRLQQAVDNINHQFGKHTITSALQTEVLSPPDSVHAQASQTNYTGLRQLLDVGEKSPAYTTRLSDIITLHC